MAKELKIKSVGLKTEDLRSSVIEAVKKASKEPAHPVKASGTWPKPEPATAKKAETKNTEAKKPVAKKETKKAEPKAELVHITKEHLKEAATLPTKKQRILYLHDLGYKAAAISQAPSVAQHVTNVLAALRAAGLGTGKTVSEEVKEQIRSTVTAKVAKKVKAKPRKK